MLQKSKWSVFSRGPAFAALLAAALLSACGGGGEASNPSPPVLAVTGSVAQGQAPLAITFDSSKSTDPQGKALSYSWNFGDGSASVSGAVVSHTYDKHGTYSATLTATDGQLSSTKAVTIVVAPAPPVLVAASLALNVLGVVASSTTASITATDREGLPITYSVSIPPNLGKATIDPNTGVLTYTVPGHVTQAADSVTVQASNGGSSSTSVVKVVLNFDPLLTNQWHIQNVGQDAFASVLPISGNDINVASVWASGITGKGIKVGVVDTGLEIKHEDLAANVDKAHSINFLTGTNDPTASVVGFDHGTAVAGIIGAVAFNGVGGRGIAYNATLRGYNLIAPGAWSITAFTRAAGGDPLSADNDLFNFSFGPQTAALPSASGVYNTINFSSFTLRGGLGATFANAAGNDFNDFEGNSGKYCSLAQKYGVSCGDPAQDERRGGYTPLVVGAIDADGKHSSYSSTGSALWISAPGGEYGADQSMVTTKSGIFAPAIVTTIATGCANAMNTTLAVNRLDNLGVNPLSAKCQYTAEMNGTSSATPNVAGVIALMLEANPKLSIRDIKYILATTAKRTDPTFTGVSASGLMTGVSFELEQGWTKNAAGLYFSNRYGFGAVDAGAAVAAAKGYTNYLPPLQDNTGTYRVQATTLANATVARDSATGTYGTYNVFEKFNTVEYVVVYINLQQTPSLVCNQIELTSPSGTKSILMHAGNGFTNSSVVNSRFLSNAFYGEPVNGKWLLRFLDICPGGYASTLLSLVSPQTLLFSGH